MSSEIAEGIELGREYYWKRSGGWKNLWDDGTNWWEWFVEINGFNGAGGLWITEVLKWHNSGATHSTQPRTLSYEDSAKLIRELQANLPKPASTGPTGQIVDEHTFWKIVFYSLVGSAVFVIVLGVLFGMALDNVATDCERLGRFHHGAKVYECSLTGDANAK